MWIVMTSAAKMPQSCRGVYRNVALVHLNQEYTARGLRPAMISERARGIVRLSPMRTAIVHLGHHSVGSSTRCAYELALVDAQSRADRLNNLAPTAQAGEIMTWGGSA